MLNTYLALIPIKIPANVFANMKANPEIPSYKGN